MGVAVAVLLGLAVNAVVDDVPDADVEVPPVAVARASTAEVEDPGQACRPSCVALDDGG